MKSKPKKMAFGGMSGPMGRGMPMGALRGALAGPRSQSQGLGAMGPQLQGPQADALRNMMMSSRLGAAGALAGAPAQGLGAMGSQMQAPMRTQSQSMSGPPMKKGGAVSASKRADGCAQRGKTRGKMV